MQAAEQIAAVPATGILPGGLPRGRRSPRGRVRWYLVHTEPGREQATCDRVRLVVSPELLRDAFVMRQERWFKQAGTWSIITVQPFPEYFFVATPDVVALDRELSRLSFPARIAGAAERAYVPMADDAQAWFERALDASHVLRNSVAVIVDGELHVQEGPLVGQESRVSRIDRHRRRCTVRVSDADGGFSTRMPLDVPFKG